ncbi:angiotensin-converting enzyme-like [Tigriopus californicus]|uniref:angiotensin-converting enzyme-like n=1 Tax=Tigriopus californicus TaxID=6832 RepID=UPI0027D9D488|nr:angiotensin-converting enzyme-like [Tigriopus californicus]
MGWNLGLVVCCLGVTQVLGQSVDATTKNETVEEKAAKFVDEAESELTQMATKSTIIEWSYATNLTDENEQKSLDFQKEFDQVNVRLGTEARKFDLTKISDKVLKRKLKHLSLIGASALPKEKLERYNILLSQMQKIYSTAKVQSRDNESKLLSLEPDLSKIFADSEDAKELEYYWVEWRNQSGKQMREKYLEFIEFTNEAARLNGLRNGAELKIQGYESETFIEEMEETWLGLKPLYEQIHAYVRNKLVKKYGKDVVSEKGPIPAHLLGNMWAQSWNNLGSFLKPFPDKPAIDVTDAMVEQGWTPKIMFEKAEDFFLSMGLPPMREEFWNGSIIEKPDDGREMVCHASAWDFYNGKDFRIKQCTTVTEEDFITVNHEMGHTQYQMSYANLSYLHRNGANAGFHEGVADILSLAVGTPSYYQRLGLMKDDFDITDKETNINLLFDTALERLAFMPFGYLIDKYRWDLFRGWANETNMNCHWVKLRLDIQGVAPPVKRSEEDFDAGAKYHVAANTGYIRYFVAYIYEFQFYKELCEVSGQYDPNDPKKPLHLCNFYGNKEAGDRLLSMISLGASKPWKEVIKHMTGSPKMDTGAFREYFRPLEKWLEEENRKNGVHVGWEVEDLGKYCQASTNATSS